MSLYQDLEALIRSQISLGRENGLGWEQCKCADCDDYKERGAFRFDGSIIGYNCFNCGLKLQFDSNEYKRPSKRMIEMLVRFGIQEDVIKALVAKNLIQSGSLSNTTNAAKEAAEKLEKWSPPKEFVKPTSWVPLESGLSPWCEVAIEYLKVKRALTPQHYGFFVSDDRAYEGRLIIPFWHGDRLIYWQGRSLDDGIFSPRYINPTAEKEKIIFNYDELQGGPSVEPLFITEGAIDAISIGKRAVALNGSTISDWQHTELKKVARRGRKLIFVIDKNENGYNLGMKALKEGWSVTVLPDGVDDSNKGLVRFGKLWLLSHLTSTAVNDFAGKLLLEAKCEKRK